MLYKPATLIYHKMSSIKQRRKSGLAFKGDLDAANSSIVDTVITLFGASSIEKVIGANRLPHFIFFSIMEI